MRKLEVREPPELKSQRKILKTSVNGVIGPPVTGNVAAASAYAVAFVRPRALWMVATISVPAPIEKLVDATSKLVHLSAAGPNGVHGLRAPLIRLAIPESRCDQDNALVKQDARVAGPPRNLNSAKERCPAPLPHHPSPNNPVNQSIEKIL